MSQYTLDQVTEILKVSRKTVYRYVEHFGELMPTVSRGAKNRLLFTAQDLEFLSKVRNLKVARGLSYRQIRELLSTVGEVGGTRETGLVSVQEESPVSGTVREGGQGQLVALFEEERIAARERDEAQRRVIAQLAYRVEALSVEVARLRQGQEPRAPRSRQLTAPVPPPRSWWVRTWLSVFAPHKLRVNPERSWSEAA